MNPPTEMAYAKWENLSSNIGNQYFWFGRIFGPDFKRDNLLWYITNYAEPGTLDTSLVATDGNNNPNTMNSVFQLLPRVLVSLQSPREQASPDTLQYMPRLDQGYLVPDNPNLEGTVVNSDPKGANDVKPLRFTKEEQKFLSYLGLTHPDTGAPLDRLPPLGDSTSRHTPKVLADGADSIGGRGALCRVYLNIGEFSDQWLELHNTMVGITKQRPFKMVQAAKNSVNWSVTMRRSTNLAKYFLVNSVPMRLQNAPGGAVHVKPNNDPLVLRGAEVFARDCFVCHSSLRQPDGFWQDAANWKKWIQTPNYVQERAQWLVELLNKPLTGTDGKPKNDPFFEEFVKKNYLSTDARYHVSEIGTNSGRSLADNAGSEDRMWADYSSVEFKKQTRKATRIEIAHPYDRNKKISWPLHTDAGPGRYRPHSLSSMWAHGPYLHNNSVGYYPYEYGPDPRAGLEGQALSTFASGIQSVESRVKIFDDAARRLLGLESTPDYNARKYRRFSTSPRRGFDSIMRFEDNASLVLPHVVVPDLIYMQTLAIFGFGIPRFVVFLLLLLLLLLGIWLFIRGGRRLREGRGSLLRNLAAIAIGAIVVLKIVTLWQKDEYRIGHIPKGTPVNLLININGPAWVASSPERKKLLALAFIGLKKADKYQVGSLEKVTVKGRPLVDILMDLSKCPDMVLDRGHEFGEYNTLELAKGNREKVSVEEREALIEFLKKL